MKSHGPLMFGHSLSHSAVGRRRKRTHSCWGGLSAHAAHFCLSCSSLSLASRASFSSLSHLSPFSGKGEEKNIPPSPSLFIHSLLLTLKDREESCCLSHAYSLICWAWYIFYFHVMGELQILLFILGRKEENSCRLTPHLLTFSVLCWEKERRRRRGRCMKTLHGEAFGEFSFAFSFGIHFPVAGDGLCMFLLCLPWKAVASSTGCFPIL